MSGQNLRFTQSYTTNTKSDTTSLDSITIFYKVDHE